MIGFFDTTAFTGARDLTTPAWRKIAAGAKSGVLRAATTEITTGELARQARETITTKLISLEETRRKLEQFGVSFDLPVRPNDAYLADLVPTWLAEADIAVLPIPAVTHEIVVARDLAAKPPFIRSGKGYRDTLLWLSFLDWAKSLPAGDTPVYFVTGNTEDFCGPKGGLKQELQDELPPGIVVEVLATAEKLAGLIELPESPEPKAPSEVVMARALEHVDTALLYQTADINPLTWHTQVEDPTISEVIASAGEAQEIDSYEGGTSVWLVELEAEIGVTGYVYKSDLGGLDEGLHVTDGDWNNHYAEVQGYVPATIVVEVRLESDGETAEAAVQETRL